MGDDLDTLVWVYQDLTTVVGSLAGIRRGTEAEIMMLPAAAASTVNSKNLSFAVLSGDSLIGELRLKLEASSIYELLTAEVDRWQPQSQTRQVELSLQVSADLPDMDLDRMRMSQALGNVLNNAISCTEPGGHIVLRAGLERDEALAISIIDDGFGIHAADLPHVFDRFYRTDQSRSREIGGTGLELAITRAIVEAYGGTIRVTNDGPGQGVTVTFRLPLNK